MATNPNPSDTSTTDPLSFEDTVKRLTEIVQSLERGDLPLEDSLRLFEEGISLTQVSQQKLDAAQKKVEQLLGLDDEGKAQTAPFEARRDS
ncbi:exodeoxyribonuclease VII small subunit [Pajaroellobacter abortibovis]|uniref:Exodeoxyribonuclease 7 small subunit n=1 Tax=Pajaroellobacter abortibovis TaxID=1882918 RepID=A0A1L6MW42_9BACT|nr:exodeoxyribonuclease VII small subunit [Pajaroellobacter abortibovis]APR99694.1 exodeoxyribonuclease VII small subunit [Pajaroellobacter abortibovis]